MFSFPDKMACSERFFVRSVRRSIPALLAGLTFAAFGTMVAGSAVAAEGARLRVAHFAADAPAVDIYVDGQRKVANVRNESISEYLVLPAGPHTVEVRANGTAATSEAALAEKITLSEASRSTVAILGKPGALRAGVFPDDISAPADGKTRLRLINAAPDAPALDLTLNGAASGVEKVAFATTKTAEVDAGRYELALRPAGSDTDAVKIAVPLQNGQVLTVIALADGTGIKLKGLTDRAGGAAATATSAPEATTDTATQDTTADTATGDTTADTAPGDTTAAPATADTTADTEETFPETVPETTPETTPVSTPETEEIPLPVPGETNDTLAGEDPASTAPVESTTEDTSVETAPAESVPAGAVETGFGGLSGGSSQTGLVLLGGATIAMLGAAGHRRLRRR